MDSKSRRRGRWPAALVWVIIPLTVIGLLALGPYVNRLIADPESQPARATERALTTFYGAEARLAIQAFIDRNWSFVAFRDPGLLSEVATGQALMELQALRREWSSGPIYVARSASIDAVQVIDHTPTQLKAFSCEVLGFDAVAIGGTHISAAEPFVAHRMYVLQREGGAWKVAAWADFTDADHIRRDWEYVPQWEKDLLGDLPDLINKYDTCP